jgi:hypothetical protein
MIIALGLHGGLIAPSCAVPQICEYSRLIFSREALDNPADPRDNAFVIAGSGWVHGRQAARIQ